MTQKGALKLKSLFNKDVHTSTFNTSRHTYARKNKEPKQNHQNTERASETPSQGLRKIRCAIIKTTSINKRRRRKKKAREKRKIALNEKDEKTKS